ISIKFGMRTVVLILEKSCRARTATPLPLFSGVIDDIFFPFVWRYACCEPPATAQTNCGPLISSRTRCWHHCSKGLRCEMICVEPDGFQSRSFHCKRFVDTNAKSAAGAVLP